MSSSEPPPAGSPEDSQNTMNSSEPSEAGLSGLDVDAFLRELNEARGGSSFGDPHLRASYRAAAAVLAAISKPDVLRPLEGPPGKATEILKDDLVPTLARKQLGGTWMLRHDVRRDALKALGSREQMIAALEANADERHGRVQAKFEAYMMGSAPALNEQKAEELDETLQVILWLEGIVDGLPPTDEVRRELARRQFRAPFERLAGAEFRGRKEELTRLRDFVGVLPAESLLEAFKRKAFKWTGLRSQPAFTLYGPGGIGKSALMARFMLEYIELPEPLHVPFAYLDFDSPFLNVSDRSTLLSEILRQVDLQYPKSTAVRRTIERLDPRRFREGIPANDPNFFFQSQFRVLDTEIIDILGDVLAQLGLENQRPFLLVLDTFEEVQYGGAERALPLWDILNRVHERNPHFRVVISGRAPAKTLRLGGRTPDELELDGLDQDAARGYLAARGIEDHALAETLVKQVGCVPLNLQLAASLVQREGHGEKGVRDLKTSSYFFLSASAEVIQGQLYERILGHIHDPEVAKLAHPGLVLRRVTPELILEVLREPCELQVNDLSEAQILFDKLARETALVTEESGNELSHRQDLRRTMLTLLLQKNPVQAEEINRLAVAFYARRQGASAKAEQFYHTLMLGSLPTDQRELGEPEVRRSLQPSVSELPIPMQTALASLGYDVASEVLQQASHQQSEEHLAAKVEDLLPHGANAWAESMQLIEGVKYKGKNSPLYLAEARVLCLMREPDRSGTVIEEGIKFASQSGDTTRVLDLLCLKAWLLETRERWEDLAESLKFVSEYATRLQKTEALIQHRAQQLRLVLLQKEGEHEPLARELADMLCEVSGETFLSMAPLLHGVFAHTTEFRVEPLFNLAPHIAYGGLAPDDLERLLPFLREGMAQSSIAPDAELTLNDLRSTTLVHHGIVRALELSKDNQPRLLELAGVLDGVLRYWPVRLPYVRRLEVS